MTARTAYPNAQKATYSNGEQVDFTLVFEGASIVRGSVRLSGILKCQNPDTGTSYDPLTGAHALFPGITTEFEKLGVVENLQDGPRRHKMAMICLKNQYAFKVKKKRLS